MAIAMVTFGLFTSCINTIMGNGNLVTSEKPVSAFEEISTSGSAEVRYHVSEVYRVVVTIDENLDEYVEISTSNNALNIGTQQGTNLSATKFLVDVYSPVLTSVSMSGSGKFESVDKIISSTFTSTVSGSGKIEGTIESNNYSATISGSGNISITGTSNDAVISVSGSGGFSGDEFIIKNAVVKVTGSGNVSIHVEDNLVANISGSGEIKYRGNPEVESNVSGSGTINKIN